MLVTLESDTIDSLSDEWTIKAQLFLHAPEQKGNRVRCIGEMGKAPEQKSIECAAMEKCKAKTRQVPRLGSVGRRT